MQWSQRHHCHHRYCHHLVIIDQQNDVHNVNCRITYKAVANSLRWNNLLEHTQLIGICTILSAFKVENIASEIAFCWGSFKTLSLSRYNHPVLLIWSSKNVLITTYVESNIWNTSIFIVQPMPYIDSLPWWHLFR